MKWLKHSARILLFLWVALWCLSTSYRAWRGFELEPLEDQRVLTVSLSPDVATAGQLKMAYRDLYPDASEGLPVLLLHGNPMAGRAMLPLAAELGDGRRLLIPDLPGLGYSERALNRYSAENQVAVLLAFLNALDLERVHLLAYSQGSAVALELCDQVPDRVESLSMVAGVGLQKFELLGSYEWNQPLYSAYFGFLWSVRWLTPHFGLLDAPVFSSTGALNFSQTDLRRNRAFLERLEKPSLILHSAEDRLVPFAAAKAHAQAVSHAQFIELPGGHLGIFSDANIYASEILRFLNSVEDGEVSLGDHLRGAAMKREVPAVGSIIHDVIIALLLFVLVFFSEDLSCIVGGVLVAAGTVSFPAALAGCFLGIFVSDLGLYWIGRIVGEPAFKIGFIARAVEGGAGLRLRDRFEGHVFKVVFMTRFIPGSRVLAYVSAGVLRIKFPRFAFSLAVAALVWTPILVGVATVAGRPFIVWWEHAGWAVLPLLLLGVLAIYLVMTLCVHCLTYRGRRGLRGRWLRLTHWEFWPALPVYLPVFIYGCYLSMKHGGTTVWAMCNPGMRPLSGLAMESKSEILASLNRHSNAVADWTCIQSADTVNDRMEQLQRFRESFELDWPVVLKPDVGQRGEGVAIIRNEESARAYFTGNSEPVIAQRYISGVEFGVFYYRMPGASHGEIFSITEKVLPKLRADGMRTVERLILDDARAVAQAKHYLRVNADRLYEIPEAGSFIQLVQLGTHCRGAVFLDGNRYQSQALASRLDQVLSTYEGFFFGRFDLRAPSGDSMQAGEGIQILELNGVSSESTDIYDPKNSLFAGWVKLCRQWRLAFEIGAANREAGVPVPDWGEIIAVFRAHRGREPYEAS